MDANGRRIDDVFAECLWRGARYGQIHLHCRQSPREARTAPTGPFRFHDEARPHQGIEDRTQDETRFGTDTLTKAA